MKYLHVPALVLSALFLLGGCAGTPQTPAPVAPPKPAPAAPARPAASRTCDISFDPAGNAHGTDGQIITREWVVAQLSSGKLDKKTVVRITVPRQETREQSIAAFARANRVAKIFDLYGFESVLVALAP